MGESTVEVASIPPLSTVEPDITNAASPPSLEPLSLSLTRDQGTLHSSGTGAGSEMASLSRAAIDQHSAISPIVLSYSSSFQAVHAALNPSNLPKAPTELPTLLTVGEGSGGEMRSANASTTTSATGTPSISRSPSPPPPLSRSASSSRLTATAAAHSDKSPGSSPLLTSTPLLPLPISTAASSSSASSTSSTTKANQQRPAVPVERRSVFGKLFERNNASSSSVSSVSSATPAPPSATTTASNGDMTMSPPPVSAAASGGGATLVRKISKKEKEKEDKLAGRPRAESNGYLSSSSATEKWGMGAALNEFMRNKVARKSSVNSKKSDDGKSDRGGSAYNRDASKDRNNGENGDERGGGSQHGGSNGKGGGSVAGEETKSKSGQTTASTLKKYGVCEKVLIGKGATAVVKLAHKWDRSSDRYYAVKEFRKRRKNETEKEYVKKLTSEFCISSTLHHQNIVETVDLVQDEQSHWCEVMEYCPGGDLYAAIKKGTLTPPQINSYFKQILHGVAYLHSMGVAHRDIKPENLLLDAKGHVKITDFGVSDVFRMCWEKTTHMSKGLCGSEPYIAPEQFEQKEYDARLVDVWAIAVVYYCMNFQELPWRLAKPSDPSFGPYLASYATTLSPAPLGNLVPRECRAVIKKMLDPDPKKRVGVLDILNEEWVKQILILPKEDGVGGAPNDLNPMGGLIGGGTHTVPVVAAAVIPPPLPAPALAVPVVGHSEIESSSNNSSLASSNPPTPVIPQI